MSIFKIVPMYKTFKNRYIYSERGKVEVVADGLKVLVSLKTANLYNIILYSSLFFTAFTYI